MTQLDDVWEEIRHINERLDETDSFDEQITLNRQKSELQAVARQISTESTPIEVLEDELERLRERLGALEGQRVDPVRQAGGGGEGTFGFAADAWRLNKKIDAALGRDEVADRITWLEEEIARRRA